MRRCFEDLPFRQEIECSFISIDLEGHTKLRQLLSLKSPESVSLMLDKYRQYVFDAAENEELCLVKWDGDGGIFAAYGSPDFSERMVRACLAIVSGWYAFTLNKSTNPTRHGLTLRIGNVVGTLRWNGDITNIESLALNLSVKLEQHLREILNFGSVKFAISDSVFLTLPSPLRSEFISDSTLSTLMAGKRIYRYNGRIEYALPRGIPTFTHQIITTPIILNYPIETMLTVTNNGSSEALESEWALATSIGKKVPEWHRIPFTIPPYFTGNLRSLHFLANQTGQKILPSIVIRYRVQGATEWISANLGIQYVNVEAPKRGEIESSLEIIPRVPLARTPINLSLAIKNSGNLSASVSVTLSYKLMPLKTIQFGDYEHQWAFEWYLKGYEKHTEVVNFVADFPGMLQMQTIISSQSDVQKVEKELTAFVDFNWSTPCFGRDDLIRNLLGVVQSSLDGNGKFTLVQGLAGFGKSTAVAAAIDLLEKESILILTYQLDSLSPRIYDWPMSIITTLRSDIMRVYFKSHSIDINEYLENYVEMINFFSSAEIVDLFSSREAFLEESKESNRQENMFVGFCEMLINLSFLIPLVIYIDDLHNAQSSLLKLLNSLAYKIIASRITFLGTIRTEALLHENNGRQIRSFIDSLVLGDRVKVIECEALKVEGVEEWLKVLFNDSILRPGFALELTSATGGRPLYIKNCLLQMYDSKLIRHTRGQGWFIDFGEELHFTYGRGLDDVLKRSFENLPSYQAKSYAQSASVVGLVVPMAVLEFIMPINEESEIAIDQLIERQILRVNPPKDSNQLNWATNNYLLQDDSFIFDHGRLQEVIYDTLLPTKRRSIHRQIALYYEEKFKDALFLDVTLLAHHWYESGEIYHALPYLFVDAEHQFVVGALVEALTLYQKVYQCVAVSTVPMFLVIKSHAATRIATIRRRQGERGNFEIALVTAEETISELSISHNNLVISVQQKQISDKVVMLGTHLPEISEVLADYYREKGKQQQHLGSFDEAHRYYILSLEQSKSSNNTKQEREVWKDLGLLAIDRGDNKEAVQSLEVALNMCDDKTPEGDRASILQHLGRALFQQGKWSASRQALELALKMGETKSLLASAHNYLGEVLRLQGNWNSALDEFLACFSLAEETGEKFTASFTISNRAKLAFHVGLFDITIKLTGRYIDFCIEAGGFPYGRGIATIWCGLALFYKGERVEGIRTLKTACAILENPSTSSRPAMRYGISLANLYLGQALYENNDTEEAYEHIERARKGFIDVGDDYHLTKTKLLQFATDLKVIEVHSDFSIQSEQLKEIFSAVSVEHRDLLAQCYNFDLILAYHKGQLDQIKPLVELVLSNALGYNTNYFKEMQQIIQNNLYDWHIYDLDISNIASQVYTDMGSPKRIELNERTLIR